MADPFSIGSGIVGILGLTISIAQIVVQFGLDWKDAPKEAKSIISELQSLKVVMLEIERAESHLLLNADFIDAFQDRPSVLLSELGPNAPATTETKLSINVCKLELESLLDKLKNIGKGHRVGWERLKAPFLAKDLQKSIDKAHRQCRILNDMVSYDAFNLGVDTLGQVKRARKEQKQWHDAQKNQEILSWLSNLSFEQKQTDILSKQHPGTGEWFLNLDMFKAWRNGHQDKSSTLWCPGIPGAGKSVMTSIVIASLQEIFDKDDVSISYLYCDYKDRAKQTTANLLASLVKQLVMQHKDVPTEVMSMLAEHSKRKSSLSAEECSRVFPSLLHGFRRSFILVDALDEHFTSDNEKSILEVSLLDELLKLQQTGPGYTLFITSRGNQMIQERLSGTVHIEISAANADIELYLRSRIYDHSKFRFAKKMRDDNDLADLVVGSLLKKARGMFLLPRLHIDRLSCQTNVRDLRKALEVLPTRLEETYSEAMTRIQGQVPEHSQLALSALRWISHAIRPLGVEEIQCALAVQPGDRWLDKEAIPEIALIVSVSAGLITIDAESQIIRLVQFTVEEYFKQMKHKHFPDANTLIAETCITYLSFDVFGFDPLPIRKSNDGRAYIESLHVFLEYAAYNWGYHLRADAEHALGDLALDFLMNDGNLVYPGLAFTNTQRRGSYLSPPDRVTGFYLMVYFGLTHILSMFPDQNCSFRNYGGRLLTPLSLAVTMGHTEIVKMLLDRKVLLVDKHDETKTPVHYAVENGHETILKLLLDRPDIIADSSDKFGKTPLHYGSKNGYEGITRLLLEREDVRSDSSDGDKRTPMHYAVESQSKAITKMLLERQDVNADAPDLINRTPLSYAAMYGLKTITKLLLERSDVNANSLDGHGRTPLSYAVMNRHDTIVKLLLRREDVEATQPDKFGHTPLWHAALRGQESIVKILLARDDIAVNHPDKDEQTPLSAAIRRGHTTIVKLLLECGDIRPDLRDQVKMTPFLAATRFGRIDVVRLLIERDELGIDQIDLEGRTPLFWAVRGGHTNNVKLLLERNDVKPDGEDKDGSTPLLVAAKDGNSEIVQLLIKRDDVAINHQDCNGGTPFFWAVWYGNADVVKLLVERKDVRFDLEDGDGCTPLFVAARQGYIEIVQLLMERDNVAKNHQDCRGRTPLSWAARYGEAHVAELLIECEDVRMDLQDEDGETPLSIATRKGYTEVARLLEEKMAIGEHKQHSTKTIGNKISDRNE